MLHGFSNATICEAHRKGGTFARFSVEAEVGSSPQPPLEQPPYVSLR